MMMMIMMTTFSHLSEHFPICLSMSREKKSGVTVMVRNRALYIASSNFSFFGGGDNNQNYMNLPSKQ